MEVFESREKIKFFDILDPRFAAEAIIAHLIFCGIFAIRSIFDLQSAENRFLLKSPKKAWFHLHHTSKWAKSDRNSLSWLKMKSERSLQKQHFFSHFKDFQLKMRSKSSIFVCFVVRTLQTCSNPQIPRLFLFLH